MHEGVVEHVFDKVIVGDVMVSAMQCVNIVPAAINILLAQETVPVPQYGSSE